MISVKIDAGAIAQLRKTLGNMQQKLPRELATAINATARKVKIQGARELKKVLTVKVSVLKKAIRFTGKASKTKPRATILFAEGYPISLKYFRATQLKKGGVTYKINPAFGRKSIIRDAFIAKQYRGHVYRRKGAARGPLERVNGPSPGEAYARSNIEKLMRQVVAMELPKQIERRIRLILLRQQGIVKPRAGMGR